MLSTWIIKQQKVEQRHLDRVELAKAICNAILFWSEKHPESKAVKYASLAEECLQALSQGYYNKLSITKDNKGFNLSVGSRRGGGYYKLYYFCLHCDMADLPNLHKEQQA